MTLPRRLGIRIVRSEAANLDYREGDLVRAREQLVGTFRDPVGLAQVALAQGNTAEAREALATEGHWTQRSARLELVVARIASAEGESDEAESVATKCSHTHWSKDSDPVPS